MPAHCFALLRTSGAVFGQEKYIFGFSVFKYTYWALVRAPGRLWWVGFQWMDLDDDFPIRKVVCIGLLMLGLVVRLVGHSLS